MRRRARPSRGPTCGALALALLAASCGLGPRSDPTRFYVLTASGSDYPPVSAALALGLGPITMPGYLQHPMLATRVGTEIRYAEFDRWAEPLPTLFGRALGRDLGALLGARVVQYPWSRAAPLDVLVRVDVSSFEVDASGNARLEACWTVRDSRTRTVRWDDCSSVAEAVDERGVQGQVAALGRAVNELARRVESAIRSWSCSQRWPVNNPPGKAGGIKFWLIGDLSG